jgi:prepilin peptidase CpaA
MLNYLTVYLFPALLLLAAAYDVAAYRIPNWIPAAMTVAFLPVAVLAHMPWLDIGLCFLVGFVVLLIGMTLFAFKWFGGGDAKLAAAAAVWVGFDSGPHMGIISYAIAAGIIGGAFAFLLLMFRRFPLPAALAGQTWLMRLHTASEGIPYGVALAGAGILIYQKTLLYSYLMS